MAKRKAREPPSLFRLFCYCDKTRKTGGLRCECVDSHGNTVVKAGEIVMKAGPTVR